MKAGCARWAGRLTASRGSILPKATWSSEWWSPTATTTPPACLTVCAKGYGKRTLLTEYRAQNRGGKGLIDIQTSERNGPVVAVSKVTEDDEVMLTTSGGMGIRIRVSTMRTIGRNTQGVRLIKLDERRRRQQPGQAARGRDRRRGRSGRDGPLDVAEDGMLGAGSATARSRCTPKMN